MFDNNYRPLVESIENKRQDMGTLTPPNMDEYTEDLNKVSSPLH